jgi:hypothetical protein
MSDTNSPGQRGTGDSGEASWPEYLTGGESHGAAASGASAGARATEGHGAPRRVIGTPPPAVARTLLPADQGDGGHQVARELPADPPDLRRAKRAERVVAACFIIAGLAGLAFLVFYGTIGV